jgi:WD40 repeat protein
LAWRSALSRWAWRLRLISRPAPMHQVWLWDLSTAGEPAAASETGLALWPGVRLDTDALFLSAMIFAPSAPAFAALTDTGLRLYRLEPDGRLVEQSLVGKKVHPQAVPVFTPDGRSLVVRLRDGSLQAWDVATGKLLDHATGPGKGSVFVYAPDSGSALALKADGTARFWDLRTGEEQAILTVGEPPAVAISTEHAREENRYRDVVRAAFSPDGRTLALANSTGGVAWCSVAEVQRKAKL